MSNPSLNDVLTRAALLPPVPERAADAYEARAELMAALVFQELAGRPETVAIRKGEGLEVMEGHYRNHILLMDSAFRLNSFELLARTLPWAYRVLAVRRVELDYLRLQLLTWRKAVQEYLSPALAAPILQSYDWLIAEHPTMTELWRSPETFLFAPAGPAAAVELEFTECLLQGERRACLQLAESAAHTPGGLATFYTDVLQNALCRVGQLWERGEITVATEHVATAIALAVTAALYPRVVQAQSTRGLAVVACTPNEQHEIGARMVADFLELAGWEVIHLGANVPQASLLQLLRRKRPFLLALSVNAMFNLGQCKRLIEAIRACPELGAIRIMVGGRALNSIPGLSGKLGGHGVATDAATATSLANSWWAETSH